MTREQSRMIRDLKTLLDSLFADCPLKILESLVPDLVSEARDVFTKLAAKQIKPFEERNATQALFAVSKLVELVIAIEDKQQERGSNASNN